MDYISHTAQGTRIYVQKKTTGNKKNICPILESNQ